MDFLGLRGKLVFTNGCFDIIHPGHMLLLRFARSLAQDGLLVVGVNSDDSVRRLKGPGRPVFPEGHRRDVLRELTLVDRVYIFREDTPYDLIHCLRPDIIVKGGDYKPEDVVGSNVAQVIICPLDEQWSTTKILEGRNA
jgi:rfaE bifunctional protein nucleotidyltransferase chain/domain